MFDTILERPILVGIIGIVVSLALLWLWLQTTIKPILYAAFASIILTLVLCGLGVSIETPREQLTQWLNETAAELGRNEFDKIQAKIHPGATPELRSLEGRALGIRFNSAVIKKIHDIVITERKPTSKAIVKMNVFVELEFGGGQYKIPRYVELTMYQADGKWLVSDAMHQEPTYGFKKHDE